MFCFFLCDSLFDFIRYFMLPILFRTLARKIRAIYGHLTISSFRFTLVQTEDNGMGESKKIGIVICDRYRTCAGGKCFRAFRNREGAFSVYKGMDAEIAAFTTCGGCPGGNIEYLGEEMVKNGVSTVHLATGFLVGYPPCPSIDHFAAFLKDRYKLEVVIGTHPVPEKYKLIHDRLQTWRAPEWKPRLAAVLSDDATRKAYD